MTGLWTYYFRYDYNLYNSHKESQAYIQYIGISIHIYVSILVHVCTTKSQTFPLQNNYCNKGKIIIFSNYFLVFLFYYCNNHFFFYSTNECPCNYIIAMTWTSSFMLYCSMVILSLYAVPCCNVVWLYCPFI